MPIVTRADCSTLEWNGNFIFRHTYMPVNTNMIKVTGQTTINVVHCDGANGISNDLQMHYEKLFLDGKVNATQKALFEETLIGEHDCTSAKSQDTDFERCAAPFCPHLVWQLRNRFLLDVLSSFRQG